MDVSVPRETNLHIKPPLTETFRKRLENAPFRYTLGYPSILLLEFIPLKLSVQSYLSIDGIQLNSKGKRCKKKSHYKNTINAHRTTNLLTMIRYFKKMVIDTLEIISSLQIMALSSSRDHLEITGFHTLFTEQLVFHYENMDNSLSVVIGTLLPKEYGFLD